MSSRAVGTLTEVITPANNNGNKVTWAKLHMNRTLHEPWLSVLFMSSLLRTGITEVAVQIHRRKFQRKKQCYLFCDLSLPKYLTTYKATLDHSLRFAAITYSSG